MKYALIILGFNLFSFLVNAQKTISNADIPNPEKKVLIVEASCGECQFGLPGKGCNLAIRIDGHAYFVNGTNIDSYGDAHAKDGFCEAIRKAEVQGELIDNQFKLSYFKLQNKIIDEKPKK